MMDYFTTATHTYDIKKVNIATVWICSEKDLQGTKEPKRQEQTLLAIESIWFENKKQLDSYKSHN